MADVHDPIRVTVLYYGIQEYSAVVVLYSLSQSSTFTLFTLQANGLSTGTTGTVPASPTFAMGPRNGQRSGTRNLRSTKVVASTEQYKRALDITSNPTQQSSYIAAASIHYYKHVRSRRGDYEKRLIGS
jgi:hypothetical protein